MPRKKSDEKEPCKQICFRCPVTVKRGLEDLAHSAGLNVTDLLVELATEYVKAHKNRISNFRLSYSSKPLKTATFDEQKSNTPTTATGATTPKESDGDDD